MIVPVIQSFVRSRFVRVGTTCVYSRRAVRGLVGGHARLFCLLDSNQAGQANGGQGRWLVGKRLFFQQQQKNTQMYTTMGLRNTIKLN